MKRLLITGGSGFLGRELARQARGNRDVAFTWHRNPVDVPGSRATRLDILDKNSVNDFFKAFLPDAVIHTAYSHANLDTISTGTENIAQASASVGARLVHLSTDAVFDGERGHYREDDIPEPIHPYGRAKLTAEKAVEAVAVKINAVIVRTSLLWGLDPIDPRTLDLKERLERGDRPVLFTDEYRCPVLVSELATALLEIIDSDFSGIIHLAGPERLTRYDFGRMLARYLGCDLAGIIPGLSRESGMVRPLDCSMDTSLVQKLLRTRISSPSELLDNSREVLDDITINADLRPSHKGNNQSMARRNLAKEVKDVAGKRLYRRSQRLP